MDQVSCGRRAAFVGSVYLGVEEEMALQREKRTRANRRAKDDEKKCDSEMDQQDVKIGLCDARSSAARGCSGCR
jgi:hypothetical protein